MDGPLDGIRVLEVANWVAAPAAATLLADLGASVIKVEPPQGDISRGYAASGGSLSAPLPPSSPGFEMNNRGKRAMCVDLGHAEGRDIVKDLAKDADVLVTNLTPKRLARFDLGYESVRNLNPRLIYAAVNAYGAKGPERDRLGFDYTAFWARSGIMSLVGDRDGPPVVTRPGFGDHITAIVLAYGIMIALYDRQRTGKGQEIQASLLNSAIWALGGDVQAALAGREPLPKHRRLEPRNPLSNPYQAKDGRWIHFQMGAADRYWAGFCAALGLESLREDPRFTTLATRQEHSAELVPLIDAAIAQRTRDEWWPLLDEHNLVWSPVQSVQEVIVDPQVRLNGYISEFEHPNLGRFETIATPVRFGESHVAVRGPAPELGQHTEEVLLERGHTWEQIESLRDSGAVGSAYG
ncbi:MAG TPA: CoA transferase [Dehalococcoidia bacterium]|nr:CoA transferase [Dehalococcoidia bacterium]